MYDWAELRHFRYLLTILQKGGFRAAAEELYTSQPNLSVQARQFQENASIRLFRKSKSGRIYPTRTGLAFLALAPSIFEVRDEIIDTLIAIERGEISSVRFGCTPLVNQTLFRTFCEMHKELMPKCFIRPTRDDMAHLVEEIVAGTVDAAVVTLPLTHPELHVEEVSRDRLVACLRKDHALALKATLDANDLQNNLAIFCRPQWHPDAHQQLLQFLAAIGITVKEYSFASHPSEMQELVKEGYGFALIQEGAPLEKDLITRPIAGVDWAVDTAVVYHRERHPKTVPFLAKKLSRMIQRNAASTGLPLMVQSSSTGETQFGMQAGRRFPGNEEALLIAFSRPSVPPTDHLPQGKGFSVFRVDLGHDSERCWLAISRRPEGSLDLFTLMVRDIIDTLHESGPCSEDCTAQLLFSRICAWQDFMRRDTDGILEPQAELGLIGELLFLQMICRHEVPPTIPITGWVGPIRGIQDFVLGCGAIEVKTTIANNGFTAAIDSLDQLDDARRQPLFLAAVRLRLDERGLSLPDIIDEIRTMINDPFDRGAFDTKLLHAGYLDAAAKQYTRHFAHQQTRVFLISERFPRITRYAISPAIIAARYELDIERVAEAPVTLSSALNSLGVS